MTDTMTDSRPKVLQNTVPTFSLPPVIAKFQKVPPDTPFESDEEYFQAILACETTRYMAHRFKNNLAQVLFNTDDDDMAFFDSTRIQNGKQLSEMMNQLLLELDEKRSAKVLLTKNCTLIVEKFLENMKATEWESKIFRMFLCSASNLLQGFPIDGYYDSPRTDTISWIQNFFPEGYSVDNISALFLDTDSKWVKEHIFTQLPNLLDQSNLSKMPELVVSSFMGLNISVSQYQELDSTCLQDTLLQSERFRGTAAGKAILEHKKIDEEIANEGDDDELNNGNFADTNAPFLKAVQKFKSLEGSSRQSDRIYNLIADAAKHESVNVYENAGDQTENEELQNGEDGENEELQDGEDMELVDNEEGSYDTTLVDKYTDSCIDNNDHEESALSSTTNEEFAPYKNNLLYLEEQITLLNRIVVTNKDKNKLANDFDNATGEYYNKDYAKITKEQHDQQIKNSIEKNEKKIKKLKEKIKVKLAATKPMPRLEQLVIALDLDEFEKLVLLNLIKSILMPNSTCGEASVGTHIGDSIESFACSLEEKMNARKYFYKTSRLIQEGILYVSQNDFMQDLTYCSIDLDRRMFDFLVGLDTEFSEVVDGSHLYLPNVQFDDTVLPAATKAKILERVAKFDEIKQKYVDLQLDEKITYGTGQVLLFYGASGTGKTMMANAIATKLKKKVLLVNFPSLGSNSSGKIIKFLFREARIQKALLFFDECESLFYSRDHGESSVNMVLTELERYDGLCILATNRPMDIDEAMHRRITLAVEFHRPDRLAREQIWKNLHPPKLALSECVNLCELARKYELTGGHIKNAWLSAIGLMVQRGGDKVTQQDLMLACSDQVIGRLSLEEFDRRVVATCGLDSMVVSVPVKESLESIVHYTQAQTVLFGSWGFGSIHRASTGVSALFCGPPGTGKTMAAEAISFDLGKPLMVVNVADLVSKWVGETGKNIAAVFDTAKSKDVVLVFDEADGLFGERGSSSESCGRHDNMNVGLLLQYIDNFPGVCIVITNKKSLIDDAFFRRFTYVVHFKPPDTKLRHDLWKSMIPSECPLGQDVDLPYLATRYKFCGGDIKSALFNAATKAALRTKVNERFITQEDLEKACDEEEKKARATSSEYIDYTSFDRNVSDNSDVLAAE